MKKDTTSDKDELSKVIIAEVTTFESLLAPFSRKLDKVLELLTLNTGAVTQQIFSDREAALYLSMSTKKLQSLRNSGMINFVREPYGRKVTYTIQHLVEYINKNTVKKR